MDIYFQPLSFLTEAPDPNRLYIGQYDPSLVALSIAIAVFAAYMSLLVVQLSEQAAPGRSRRMLLILGGVGFGVGIWSMHFIGMLGFSLPCNISYGPWTTALSMVPGVLAGIYALRFITSGHSRKRDLLLGGTLFGGGIGLMHFTGMAAMRMDAYLRYDPGLFALSILVAVLLSISAFWLRTGVLGQLRLPGQISLLLSALVLGLAVSGMHYTAMTAAYFEIGDLSQTVSNGFDPVTLSLVIGLAVFIMIGMMLITVHRESQARFESAGRISELLDEIKGREVLLTGLVESTPDALFTVDKSGRIQVANRRASELFGYTKEEFIGRDISMLLPERLRSGHATHLTSFFEAPKARQMGSQTSSLFAEDKQGREFPIEVALSPYETADGLMCIAILRDITERKLVERELVNAKLAAEQSSRVKSEFLATMSHELRTPMNGIIGMNTMLLQSSLSKEQQEFAHTIQHSADALLVLLNDILDISKIEAGKLDIEQIDFDLYTLLDTFAQTLTLAADQKGLAFNLSVSAKVPQHLCGDPGRLRQILNNLAGNAIKFTEAGQVQIDVESLQTDNDSILLKFIVSDSGIGIPESKFDRLFQQFSQVDSSTTRTHGGTGLGLAICKRLSDMMGGDIGVESEQGKGSRFWFTARFTLSQQVVVDTLDTAPQRPAEPHLEPDPEPQSGPTQGSAAVQTGPISEAGEQISPPQLLLVEDNLINQKVAVGLLKKLGCQVDVANNGQEGVEALEQKHYDLVFMDMQMPVMSGVEATRAIRAARDKAYCQIPIVAMTANAMEEDRQACMDAGMNDFLTKPLSVQRISEALNLWLELPPPP
ncbi:MHYT domain-containing protein [Marinobacterium mangrovicola]|uniref:Sensory/regulatory protein RpfC n=1 Tax=Marinobacterium mangrovicola TaxID=1476959 RepID=A0A4R1GAC0_9GAMM|nr:MHYT domain-containing protein [Marinobacterium mangrovicola]TCK03663.1 PAS domain S-box-containing protein [Marinobacterium mangrovicola]